MKASASDQRSILDIQKFDLSTATLKNKAATLPEHAEITTTSIKQNNVRDLRIAAETELSDVKRELARAEGDVEQVVLALLEMRPAFLQEQALRKSLNRPSMNLELWERAEQSSRKLNSRS